MANKEPFVIIDHAVTPAPAYVSNGDNYSSPTPGAWETDIIRDDTGSQRARYEAIRVGQAEGLGLLQGGPRPMVKRKEVPRKEVSRKPVPGHGDRNGGL